MTKSGYASVNGTRVYYEMAGSGVPVVFLHGWLLDTRMWNDQFDTFSKQFQAIRYDQRGFGKSQLPTSEYRAAEDLSALLDFLKVDQAAIVGQSNGGRIAIDFAIAFPQKTLALVVANPVLNGYVANHLNQSLVPIGQRAASHGGPSANEMLLVHEIFETTRENPSAIATIAEILADESGWHWLNADPDTRYVPPATERLSEITVPTLIAFGERDMPDFAVIKDLLKAGIPNSHVLNLPDAGHMCNMESPDLFNREVIAFLSEVSRTASKAA